MCFFNVVHQVWNCDESLSIDQLLVINGKKGNVHFCILLGDISGGGDITEGKCPGESPTLSCWEGDWC